MVYGHILPSLAMYQPLPDFFVHLTMQYLSPPSSLLPAHLTSKALQQRHHFLALQPDDPVAYYCWPKPNSDAPQVVAELEALGGLEAEQLVRKIVYDSDAEDIRARVQIGEKLQLIFILEDADEQRWKYHDACLLPFPATCHPTLNAAIAARLFPRQDMTERPPSSNSDSSSPASDAYWNGYSSTPHSPKPTSPKPNESATEDSYWAQYAAVQGSGDSTVPSPAPRREKAMSLEPIDEMSLYLQPELRTSIGTPQGLALALNTPPPTRPTIRANLPSIYRSIDSVGQLPWVRSPALHPHHPLPPVVDKNDGVAEAIRGLYRMWKASGSGDEARMPVDFVRLVNSVVADL